MVNYLEEIDLRAANSEALAVQPLAVAQALDSVSGQTLLEMSWGTLSWNSAIENVEIRQNDEPVSLSYYVDEYGRPAFVGEKVQGVIDVFGSQAYLKVTANGDTAFWLDEFTTTVDENGQGAVSLSFLAKKKCVCKGSNGTGLNNACSSDEDCRNRNTCTYRNESGDHPSQCGFFMFPYMLLKCRVKSNGRLPVRYCNTFLPGLSWVDSDAVGNISGTGYPRNGH